MKGDKLLNRHFASCLCMQFAYMISFNMTIPLIAQYVVVLGYSTALGGFVAGMFSLLALVFRPIIGFIADHANRKTLLAFGCVITVVSFVGYACAPNVELLIVFRVLHALGLCIQTTALAVVATQFVPLSRLAEGVGYVGIAATLGLALGPSIGVFVAEWAGFRMAFWGSAATTILTLALLLPLPVRHERSKKEPIVPSAKDFISLDALPLSVSAMSFAFCAGLTTSLIVLFGAERSIEGITVFFLVSSGGMMLARPFAGRIIDRKGLPLVLIPSFVSEAFAMALVAFSHSIVLIVLAAVFRVFGQGVAQVSLQGQVLKEVSEEHRGVAASTFYMGIDAGQGFGAMTGGVVADVGGFTVAYLTGPVVLLVGFAAYLVWRSRA